MTETDASGLVRSAPSLRRGAESVHGRGVPFVRGQAERFTVEMGPSEDRPVNWLSHFGTIGEHDLEPIQLRASGHASGTEIQEMVDKIEPRVLVPVHTEKPELFENASGEVEVPVEGMEIEI